MSIPRSTAVAAAAVVTLAAALMAGAPQVISFQGRLTDDLGIPVADGPADVRIIIWNDPTAALPENEVWNSGVVTVTTVGGLFSLNLGVSPMPALTPDLFADTNLWVGLSIEGQAEGQPRIRLGSAAFAFRAVRADTAAYALASPGGTSDHGSLTGLLDDDHPQYVRVDGSRALIGDLYMSGRLIRNLAPGQLASDAIRYDQAMKLGDPAGGDLAGTYPDPQLAANSVGLAELAAGSVNSEKVLDNTLSALDLANGSVQTAEIADGTIVDADISPTAAIAVDKVAGTAASLSGAQIVTGAKTFVGGVKIGSAGAPSASAALEVSKEFLSPGLVYGLSLGAANNGAGSVHSLYAAASGPVAHSGYRTGVYALAGAADATAGYSRGLAAFGLGGETAYGVYAYASAGATNWAGYFDGDVAVTGTLSKAAGSFRIDHPLDPENRYLQHSFVESPDMKNIYDGVVTTDAAGYAVVTLPDYFEALNRDFRYQLTVIGDFAQAIIAEKVAGGRFVIRTDKPNIEVSWQVTGIRHDPYAETHRIAVELDKPARERGRYQNPEAYGLGSDRSINRAERTVQE